MLFVVRLLSISHVPTIVLRVGTTVSNLPPAPLSLGPLALPPGRAPAAAAVCVCALTPLPVHSLDHFTYGLAPDALGARSVSLTVGQV